MASNSRSVCTRPLRAACDDDELTTRNGANPPSTVATAGADHRAGVGGTVGAAQRAREHELGLRHGAFLGVDDQQAAVGGPYILANMIRLALGKYAASRSGPDVTETVRKRVRTLARSHGVLDRRRTGAGHLLTLTHAEAVNAFLAEKTAPR